MRAAARVIKPTLLFAFIMFGGLLAGRAVDPQPGGAAAVGPWLGLMIASFGLPAASMWASSWWPYTIASVAAFAALFFASLGMTDVLSPGGLDALGPGGIMYLGPLMIFPAVTVVLGVIRALSSKTDASTNE